ncbi:family 2 encapsulin nanocompartment cargo protein terpene cyclase [Streptomyces sp. NPDC006984]|uniref:family 2 encapsulin nanocompartment cargo protein terpene cyclase n=1 Tax=Streptomyces sp. NPDC006984 TaxID=3155463 RepID=UPI0033E0B3EF
MPDPDLSPPQSSVPAAAARLGSRPPAGSPAPSGGAPGAVIPARAPATAPPAPFVLPTGGQPLVSAATSAPPAEPEGATAPAPLAAPVPPAAPAGSALGRILGGPSGLGTAALSLARRAGGPGSVAPGSLAPGAAGAAGAEAVGRPIPGLYFHSVPDPDPARVAEVSRRVKNWAVDEVQLFPEEWEGQFDGFSVGRYMVACHPDAPTVDHLMLATRLMIAENAVDDCYCEDHGGSPVGLGGRLLLAHTALDPLHTTAEYAPAWTESLASDAPRRAYRSAMDHFVRSSTPSQADRYRHDMARLHLGYLAEAAWAETDHTPQVWEYLAMRQFNNFRPCPTITDSVGGYELPADLHARPDMQRVIALAGNATTLVNDLYSYTKELAAPGRHLNLPVVLAEREKLSERDAYLKAVEVHNDLMHAFEAAAAELAAACPVPTVLRFLKGVAAWVDGNHYWHQTNTYRYSLPDFW